MTPKKAVDHQATQMPLEGTKARKPWVKKTPVDVVLNQINRMHDNVAQKEEELKQTKRQLQKLEEVKKILEAT